MRLRPTFALLAVCLAVIFSVPYTGVSLGSGQTAAIALIIGRITDPSGAVVPGARVLATNEATGSRSTTVSGADGIYRLRVPLGVYTVTATRPGFAETKISHFKVRTRSAAQLDIRLRAGPPPLARRTMISSLITVRAFLVGNQHEEGGYGLYSYLLLPAAPGSADQQKRYIAVISAFEQKLRDVSEFKGVPKKTLNATYLLLTEKPQSLDPDPLWVLTHYNFARARILLNILQMHGVNGPYVASTLKPLSNQTQQPDHFLWQDMSSASPEVVVLWEQEFERRAEREDFWAPDRRNQAILELRTFIANAAFAFGESNASMETFKGIVATWVAWK